jgi:hypothetical protein
MLASLRVARTTGGMVWSSGKGFEAQPKINSPANTMNPRLDVMRPVAPSLRPKR